MKYKKLLLVACLTLVGSSPALASDIYKYTDENGNIHYGDRPSGVNNETRVVAIVSRRTDNAAVQQAYQARYNNEEQQQARSTTGSAEGEDEGDRKLTRAERIAQQQEQEATCQRYRARLETLVTSRRLYRHDDAGERVYLSEAETQEARDKAQQLVEENCN